MADIHKISQRLETALVRIKKLKKKNDSELILKFMRFSFAHKRKENRVLFYLNRLQKISEWTSKDLDKLGGEDIEKLLGKIERNKDYAEWTKLGYRTTLRNFYKWLDMKELIVDIKASPKRSDLKDPLILSKEEVKKIFESADGILEKALATFMYESGCRCPDELLNMNFGDVELLNGTGKVRLVSGKVGERKILVVSCLPYLREWLSLHPDKKKDSPMWTKVTKKGKVKSLTYIELSKLVKGWVRKAGIDKRVTPYTFRRTRATHLSNRWPTPVLYKYMGWVLGSKVIERYVRLSTEDVEETVLGFYGMSSGTENNDIRPMFCSYCDQQNAPELEFCHFCGNPLTDKAKVEEREGSIKLMLQGMIKKEMKGLQSQKSHVAENQEGSGVGHQKREVL